jgi:alpha-ketoglutarate-dependent taurine dioxygenase
MKISKIPGLGNYGHYVDDVDFNILTHEEWIEIGKLNLKGLVTILRNVNITKDQYLERITNFGPLQSTMRAYLVKKYGHDFDALNEDSYKEFSNEEKAFFKNKKYFYEKTEKGTTLTRVSGKLDTEGNPTGLFSNGDLHWHSNESSFVAFAPCVSLLGGVNMVGSCTGFLQTADYYESLSDSFRSELDEMVLIHAYRLGGVNEREKEDPSFERDIKMSMCPQDGAETPLVITSPGGIKGFRYTMNTASGIKGMSKSDSDKIFAELDKHLINSTNVFDHWYQQDNDLLLFDNSITQHRRLGGHPDRVAYRYQYYPKNIMDSQWQPYDNPLYAEEYYKTQREIDQIREQIVGY